MVSLEKEDSLRILQRWVASLACDPTDGPVPILGSDLGSFEALSSRGWMMRPDLKFIGF